jgi:hypothetical protein
MNLVCKYQTEHEKRALQIVNVRRYHTMIEISSPVQKKLIV